MKGKDHKKTTLVCSRKFEAGQTKPVAPALGLHWGLLCQVYAFFPENVLSTLGTISL